MNQFSPAGAPAQPSIPSPEYTPSPEDSMKEPRGETLKLFMTTFEALIGYLDQREIGRHYIEKLWGLREPYFYTHTQAEIDEGAKPELNKDFLSNVIATLSEIYRDTMEGANDDSPKGDLKLSKMITMLQKMREQTDPKSRIYQELQTLEDMIRNKETELQNK